MWRKRIIFCHLKHKVSTVSTLCFNTDVVILCFNFFMPQTGSWHQLVEFKNAYQLQGTALASPDFRLCGASVDWKLRSSQIPRRSTASRLTVGNYYYQLIIIWVKPISRDRSFLSFTSNELKAPASAHLMQPHHLFLPQIRKTDNDRRPTTA